VIHHLSFAVNDLQRAAVFYDAALSALGYRRSWTNERGVGYGLVDDDEVFALKYRDGKARAPGAGFHLAFNAASPAAVDAFYRAAIEHGGRDNGAPGLRPHYGATYYAAFVIDPDGYEVEAVHIG
jgi:catechol 2,3-dioxygenase-like lactoylglutathione lyase family enzyme